MPFLSVHEPSSPGPAPPLPVHDVDVPRVSSADRSGRLMDVRLDIASADLVLKEKLHSLVVTGQLSSKDYEQAFAEEIVVRIKPDGRTLNRLEKQEGPVAEAIRAYRLKTP